MQATCDGGGNRDMAEADLRQDPGLRARFNSKVVASGSVSCAICAVSVDQTPQIICPNRLFYLGSNNKIHPYMQTILDFISGLAGYSSGDSIAFWKEVTINKRDKQSRSFNYRLDYVLRKVDPNGKYQEPIIIEVMTCSTSGGNKAQGSDISTAFRKAILASDSSPIQSPGVNIRQVWARMASQLIVKSQAALHWGGKAFWVVQDTLAEYINNNTGLELNKLHSTKPGEVNIIVRSEAANDRPRLYAGPIQGSRRGQPSFSDILKAPFLPSLDDFVSYLGPNPDGYFKVK